MKQILILFLIIITQITFSQKRNQIDSLYKLLNEDLHDTSKLEVFYELSSKFKYIDPDSTIYFAENALEIAKKIIIVNMKYLL